MVDDDHKGRITSNHKLIIFRHMPSVGNVQHIISQHVSHDVHKMVAAARCPLELAKSTRDQAVIDIAKASYSSNSQLE